MSPLSDADSELREAREQTDLGSDERAQVDRVEDEVELVRKLAYYQAEAASVYSDFEDVRTTLIMEESIEDVDDRRSDAASQLDDTEPVVGEHYEDKLEQAAFEIEQFEALEDARDDLSEAESRFGDNEYGAAADYADFARRDFQNVRIEIGNEAAAPPTDAVDEEFVEMVEVWEDEADDLERRARDNLD